MKHSLGWPFIVLWLLAVLCVAVVLILIWRASGGRT
jgi:hypothetical protein